MLAINLLSVRFEPNVSSPITTWEQRKVVMNFV